MRRPLTVTPISRGPADVVLAARAGDVAALGALYDRYAPALFRTVLRFTDSSADAQDVVHDVFVGLPEALRAYEETGRFEAWLSRVAVRHALMRQRAQGRRREEDLDRASHVATPDTAWPEEHSAEHAALLEAVRELPEPLRRVLVLRQVEDFSHHEIAELLGISVGNSRVRLARAIDALRRALAEHTLFRPEP